jgi:hypothetical protein
VIDIHAQPLGELSNLTLGQYLDRGMDSEVLLSKDNNHQDDYEQHSDDIQLSDLNARASSHYHFQAEDDDVDDASSVQDFELYTPDEESSLLRKLDTRLVLFLALLYMLSFLDRTSMLMYLTVRKVCNAD